MNTPSDLHAMAIECGHAWDEGMREARESMNRANEMKPKQPRKR
jgi:hypothetical protein